MLLVFIDEDIIEALKLFKIYRQHKKLYDRTLELFRYYNNLFGYHDENTQHFKTQLDKLNENYYSILNSIKQFLETKKINLSGRNDIEKFINYIEDTILFNMSNFDPRKNIKEIIEKEISRIENERKKENMGDSIND